MATFKVGQRVRRIAGVHGADYSQVPGGSEGTVCGPLKDWGVETYPVNWDARGYWPALPHSLTPLTDPKAEEWAHGKVRELLDNIPQPSLAEILHAKLEIA